MGGAGDGQLKSPHALNFGNTGPDGKQELFVVNTGNYRIEVFNTEGVFKRKFGTKFVQSTGQGQFRGDLRGIAIDRARDLAYVVDAGGNGIRVFDTAGNFIRNMGGSGDFQTPGKFLDGGREDTVDGDGNLWVGDMPNFRAQKFCTAAGKVGCKPGSVLNLFDLQVPNPTVLPAEGGFNGPRGVGVDSAGNMWVSDTYNWRMEKLNPAGDPLKVFGYRGRGPYSFNYARMVAVDRNDNSVVVTDTDNHSIKKYNSAGTLVWERTGPKNTGGNGPAQFNNPHGIDVGPDGKIYVADTGNHRVQVLDGADGHQLLAFGSAGGGSGQFTYPRGITVDPCNGDIWVSDAQKRDTIHHFAANGTPKAPAEVGSSAVIVNPFDVQVDRTYLYVADTQNHEIDVFNKSTGAYVTSFGSLGEGAGQFDTPQGLELIGNTMWVAEQQNDRIQKLTLSNTPGTACP
jgi:DNA-binding beta-propeller fold protein YncE